VMNYSNRFYKLKEKNAISIVDIAPPSPH